MTQAGRKSLYDLVQKTSQTGQTGLFAYFQKLGGWGVSPKFPKWVSEGSILTLKLLEIKVFAH